MIEIDIKSRQLLEKLGKKVGKTVVSHGLVQPGDRILVAVSGGKDSYALLHLLTETLRHAPFKPYIAALHVVNKDIGYQVDLDFIKSFCQYVGVDLHIEECSVDLSVKSKKSPCFICSWERRKIIFQKARELQCNKIAFGHHRDDAIQTLLLNMIYHGSISSLPYFVKMFEGEITLVRPLLDLDEQILSSLAKMMNYPVEVKQCKYSDTTKRGEIKKLIEELNNKYPPTGKNLFKSMQNCFHEYLPELNQTLNKIP
jgi:tRNA(Ile)-lysidine synthase TilS/MesJ